MKTETAEAKAGRAASNDITVRCWVVCHDEKRPDNTTIIMSWLSPLFTSKAKASRCLKDVREKCPDAYIGKYESYFNRLRPSDLQERKELLAKLV